MKNLLASTILLGVLFIAACGQGDTGETEDPASEENGDQTEQDDSNTSESDDSEENETSDETESNGSNDETSDQSNEQDESNAETMDQDKAQKVLKEYEEAFNKVINNTDDNGKQKEYSSKEDLKEHFMNYMSEERATSMVDTYFEERDDGLYVKAMDAPKFLQEDEEFTFTENKDGTVTVTQERNNELSGHVKIKFELINKDGNWIVNEVKSENLESEE